jgi:VanZ family protein
LLALAVLGLAYVSLYPFHFTSEAHQAGIMWRRPQLDSDWVDMAANFLGYLPLGFLAMAVFPNSGILAVFMVTLAGALFSGAIEWTQLYLPTRDSNMWDLTFNTLGCLAGSLLFKLAQRTAARFRWKIDFIWPDAGACVLILTWIFWQAFPFLPALRRYKLREFVTSLAVWNFQRIEFGDILLAAFVLYAFLARAERKSILTGGMVCLIVVPVLLAQSLILGLGFSNVRMAAALLGLALAMLLWRGPERAQWIVLAAVLCSWLIYRETRTIPLTLASPTNDFVRIAAGKTFFYFSGLAVICHATELGQRLKSRWS